MKQTIFHIAKALGEKESEHKLDYIYEPNEFGKVKFDGNSVYVITSMIDEFTENESVQIRHIHVVEHERDGVILP